ncbi:MAG TPA: head GIN domain-containing protein [Chitinophaga sp.]|uniref:head GIN domain-containing protein n=1 Tax=Chitinophaga sp. TaxID=1869181 RepID=UPI002C2A7309|nr:head GIN domain-containing protein [Chitinophaga sp.]HVI43282.1 head GIN domain-containing protein [Chitinophaga sp.]
MQTKINLRHGLVALSAALMLNGCVIGQDRIKGSGNITKEERKVPSFHKLKAEGSMNVFLSQGAEKPAVIEGDDNIIPLIELVEQDGMLKVRYKKNVSISTHHSVNIYLSAPQVDQVSLAGSGDLKLVDKFNLKDDVKVTLSGSGNFSGALNAPAVEAAIAGSGNMHLTGETRDVSISIAGSGDFDGDELMAENAKVTIAGSGNANVHASVKLDAKIAGSGDVNYKGSPQVSSSVAGSGSVQKRG